MNYVFFGTPRFAAIVLEKLLDAGMPPAALVCNPDRPIGRKKIVTPPQTKQLVTARAPGVAVLQPEKLDTAFIKALSDIKPDLFVVAAYAKIIPKTVLDVSRLGTLGVHPSLLPKYRGSSPIQSAILGGERETGVTIYRIDEKMDHGPVLAEARTVMDSLTTAYPALEEMLAGLGGTLLAKAMPAFFAGASKPIPQDESLATYTKKFATEDGFVDESDLAAAERGDQGKTNAILRKINAFTPEPGAWTIKDGKRIKLLKAEIKGGSLRLITVQKEGERPTAMRTSSPIF
jgi:methionyl-tRNA formyltransferase